MAQRSKNDDDGNQAETSSSSPINWFTPNHGPNVLPREEKSPIFWSQQCPGPNMVLHDGQSHGSSRHQSTSDFLKSTTSNVKKSLVSMNDKLI